MTQSNALSNQLSSHDTSIKSLLNNRGCVKSVQRIVKERFTMDTSLTIPISAIDLSKSILLVNNCIFRPYPYAYDTDFGIIKCTLQSSSILLEVTNNSLRGTIDIFEAQVVEFY